MYKIIFIVYFITTFAVSAANHQAEFWKRWHNYHFKNPKLKLGRVTDRRAYGESYKLHRLIVNNDSAAWSGDCVGRNGNLYGALLIMIYNYETQTSEYEFQLFQTSAWPGAAYLNDRYEKTVPVPQRISYQKVRGFRGKEELVIQTRFAPQSAYASICGSDSSIRAVYRYTGKATGEIKWDHYLHERRCPFPSCTRCRICSKTKGRWKPHATLWDGKRIAYGTPYAYCKFKYYIPYNEKEERFKYEPLVGVVGVPEFSTSRYLRKE